MIECPICFEKRLRIFENECGHNWCKSCHFKLLGHLHTTCPLCRNPIYLKKPPKDSQITFLWLVNGGKIRPRWYKKYKYRQKKSVEKI